MEQPEATLAAEAVELEVMVAAPPDVVFAYFIDAERMRAWMGVRTELDARPGGVFRVDVSGRDTARGEFVEVVPYSRVVFTFGWEHADTLVPPGSSTVEVSLLPREGGTLVRLRHTGLAAEARASHTQGWTHYLDRLRIAAAGGDPGPDQMAQGADRQ